MVTLGWILGKPLSLLFDGFESIVSHGRRLAVQRVNTYPVTFRRPFSFRFSLSTTPSKMDVLTGELMFTTSLGSQFLY